MLNLKKLNIGVITCSGYKYGLGHLKRVINLSNQFKKINIYNNITLYCISDNFNCDYFSDKSIFEFIKTLNHFNEINQYIEKFLRYDVLICDIKFDLINDEFIEFINYLHNKKIITVGIDHVAINEDINLDIRWVPSFFHDPKWPSHLHIFSGWSCFLLNKPENIIPVNYEPNLLVLTGGSDYFNLFKIWPDLLEKIIDISLTIHWVKGPYASFNYDLISNSRHHWLIHSSPTSLDDLFGKVSYVLTVHGVSFFEALAAERLVIGYVPPHLIDYLEYQNLYHQFPSIIQDDVNQAISTLNKIIKLPIRKKNDIVNNNSKYIDGSGSSRLIDMIVKYFNHA